VIGTPVGTHVFVRYGWRADAALGMGFYGFLFIILLLRGPHCQRHTWFGYEGGWKPAVQVTSNASEAGVAQLSDGLESEKDLESAVVGENAHVDEKRVEKDG